jgi:hypothetical protein
MASVFVLGSIDAQFSTNCSAQNTFAGRNPAKRMKDMQLSTVNNLLLLMFGLLKDNFPVGNPKLRRLRPSQNSAVSPAKSLYRKAKIFYQIFHPLSRKMQYFSPRFPCKYKSSSGGSRSISISQPDGNHCATESRKMVDNRERFNVNHMETQGILPVYFCC